MSDNIFSIFKRKPQSYSVFTGTPNQIKQPVTEQQQSSIGNAILSAFNRIPLWFTGNIVPTINPVIEASQYWPLQFQIRSFAFPNALAGPVPNRVIIGAPPEGKHWLITHLFADSGEAITSGVLQLQIGSRTNRLQAVRIGNVETELETQVAFIGTMTYRFNNVQNQAVQFYGLRTVYLSSSDTLEILSSGYNGLSDVTGEFRFLELPENQPFGNMISAI